MKVWFLLVALATAASAANPVEKLQERLDAGEAFLEYRQPRGYLDSLLEALDISPLTQTLVFSKTSAQFRLISPRSPRAIYFNDDVYVGWVRGGPFLEISTADPVHGASFYTLNQNPQSPPRIERDRGQCLQCHETGRTLQVPGHLTRSVRPTPDGQPAFRHGTTDIDQRTPIADRFGGWYITGDSFEHVGNQVLPDADEPDVTEPIDLSTVSNLDAYLESSSDVVAHLLLAHQTQTHNHITRAALEARKAITYRNEMTGRFGDAYPELTASVKRRIEGPAEDLLEFLLFAGEAELPGSIGEASPLVEEFSTRGPLYELDLKTRLLRTPISYLILTSTFDALPAETLGYLRARLQAVLSGEDTTGKFEHLSPADRAAIQKLLEEHKPSLIARQSD